VSLRWFGDWVNRRYLFCFLGFSKGVGRAMPERRAGERAKHAFLVHGRHESVVRESSFDTELSPKLSLHRRSGFCVQSFPPRAKVARSVCKDQSCLRPAVAGLPPTQRLRRDMTASQGLLRKLSRAGRRGRLDAGCRSAHKLDRLKRSSLFHRNFSVDILARAQARAESKRLCALASSQPRERR